MGFYFFPTEPSAYITTNIIKTQIIELDVTIKLTT